MDVEADILNDVAFAVVGFDVPDGQVSRGGGRVIGAFVERFFVEHCLLLLAGGIFEKFRSDFFLKNRRPNAGFRPDRLPEPSGLPLMLSGVSSTSGVPWARTVIRWARAEDDVHVVFDDRHGDIALFVDLFQKVDRVVGIGARHARGRFVQHSSRRGSCTRHMAISRRRLSPRESEAECMCRLVGHVDVFQHGHRPFRSDSLLVRELFEGVKPERPVALGESRGS